MNPNVASVRAYCKKTQLGIHIKITGVNLNTEITVLRFHNDTIHLTDKQPSI